MKKISKERLEKYAEFDKLVWGQMAKELLRLRRLNKVLVENSPVDILKITENVYKLLNQNQLLLDDGERLASYMSGWENVNGQTRCYECDGYFDSGHKKDCPIDKARKKHKALMEQIEKEI